MKTETVSTRDQVSQLASQLWDYVQSHGRTNVAFTHRNLQAEEVEVRSLSQNALKEKQVDYIASQVHGKDEEWTRNELKYRCGVPILCRDDEEFKDWCKTALGHLNHEQRIKAMTYVPVTRLMTPKQMSEYIDKVFDMYAPQVNWGSLAVERK